MRSLRRFPVSSTLLASGFCLLAALTQWSCSKEEEAPPPPAPTVEAPAAKAEVAPLEAPAAATPAVSAAPASPTLALLQFMPEEAQVALAIPPLQPFLDQATPVLQRFTEENLEAKIAEAVAAMGADVGVTDAKTLAEVAQGMGADANAPIALFADLRPFSKEWLEMPMPGTSAAEPARDDAAATESEPAAASAEDEADPTTDAPTTAGADATEEPMTGVEVSAEADVVIALVLTDAAKAEESIARIAFEDPKVAGKTPVKIDAGNGISITSYDPEHFAYFIHDNHLFFANNLALLKAVLPRLENPAKFRYGTSEWPVENPGELLVLGYPGRILQFMKESAAQATTVNPMAKLQLENWDKMMAGAEAEDHIVMNVAITEQAIRMAATVDTKSIPGFLKQSGTPTPLELVQLLPQETLAFLDLRLSPEMKQQMQQGMEAAGPGTPEAPSPVAGAAPFLNMLGDEIVVGASAVPNDFPALLIIMRMENPASLQGMLGMFGVPLEPGELHEEVQIHTLGLPSPLPVSVAFTSNLVILSNNVAEMKKVISLQKAAQTSTFTASLDPPFDAKLRRYGAIMLDARLLSEVALPLMMLQGGDAAAANGPALERISAAVDEVRLVSELRDQWAVSEFMVYLKPAAPAQAAAL